jgi:gluconolactonase
MKNLFITLVTLSLLLSSGSGFSQSNKSKKGKSKTIVVGEVEKLAGDFKFTEGPAVDQKGNVYFTDVRNHMILVWTLDNQLDTFRTRSGRANGLYFDKQNNLWVCEGEKGQISSIGPEGEYKVIASKYKKTRFNQPNDIWISPKGGAYFTDPLYGGDDKNIPQDGMHVYYISPDHSTVIRVCSDYEKPNGVIGTVDGKTLYVTDAQGGKTYKYDIKDDGSLSNKTLFVDLGCDGMTVDKRGNVYLTPRGHHSVDIYSPDGEFIKEIHLPERPSNVCFGGPNRKQLYITARTSIYRVETNMKGAN